MTEAFNEHFGALRDHLPGQNLSWLTALRQRTIEQLRIANRTI